MRTLPQGWPANSGAAVGPHETAESCADSKPAAVIVTGHSAATCIVRVVDISTLLGLLFDC